MDTTTARYRLADRSRRRKLRQFTDVADPESLVSELAVTRLLVGEALEAGNAALANALLGTLSKLAQSEVSAKRLRGDFLERSTLLRVAGEVVRIVSDAVAGKFPDWQSCLEQAAEEVTRVVGEATNEKPKVSSNAN